MIVKGHDFPDVTLVGVIAADLSLNMDDYHCGERTFQLLTQAVGRSGRGNKAGHAVIQTYQPEHYSIQAAAIQDYEKFYKEEMMYRMLLDYPPAAHMMTVFGACQDEELLKKAMYYIERGASHDRPCVCIGRKSKRCLPPGAPSEAHRYTFSHGSQRKAGEIYRDKFRIPEDIYTI